LTLFLLKTLFNLNPEAIENAIESLPRFLSKNKNNLRTPYQLSDDVFMEKNLSAQSLYEYCQQITSIFEVPPSEFKIEIEEN